MVTLTAVLLSLVLLHCSLFLERLYYVLRGLCCTRCLSPEPGEGGQEGLLRLDEFPHLDVFRVSL